MFFTLSVIAFSFSIAQNNEVASDSSRKDAIKLYVDCRSCDMDYMREQMPYANFMRNVQDAQVYLLVTQQSTGSGGRNYTMFFSGNKEFEGMEDTLTYASSPDDTQDVIRTRLTDKIAMGLMRYVARTPAANNIKVNYTGRIEQKPQQLEDKWNFWVFSLETRPRLSIEKSLKQYNWTNSLSANRVTEDWKIELGFNHSYNMNKFIITYFAESGPDSGTYQDFTTEAIRKSWSNDNLIVKSLTDHWSIGLRTDFSSSTYENLDLRVAAYPSIEYDIFPYSKSNQKQLRILYGIGYVFQDYIDTTFYNKTSENLLQETLDIAFEVQQKWGSANISFGAANYMHDFEKYHIELDGFLRVRLFKGFSLNINGGVALIHDQIGLPKGDLDSEDVYLRLRELETNFRYDASIGITYTFGSIYNNIVNPRFGSRRNFNGGGYGGGFPGGGF